MSETNPSIPSPEFSWPVDAVSVRRPARRYWLNLLLLVATFLTTLTVGARLQYNFSQNQPILSESDDALPMFPVSWVTTTRPG